MKSVREVLQTEIWSSRTSKWILVVLGVVIVGGVVYTDWLSPAERRACSEVLNDASSIRQNGARDSVVEESQANSRKADTDGAAWTMRDKVVAMLADSTLEAATACSKFEEKGRMAKTSEGAPVLDYSRIAASTCSQYAQLDQLTRKALATKTGF